MSAKVASERIAFSPREAGKKIGVGHDGIYEAIRDGRLVARKFGRRTLITGPELDRFMNQLPTLKLRGSDGENQKNEAKKETPPGQGRRLKRTPRSSSYPPAG
jgi:excisionase family DNA binding protein